MGHYLALTQVDGVRDRSVDRTPEQQDRLRDLPVVLSSSAESKIHVR